MFLLKWTGTGSGIGEEFDSVDIGKHFRSGGEQILTIKRSLNLAEQLHYSKVIVEEVNFNPVTRDGVDEIAAWIFKTKYAT